MAFEHTFHVAWAHIDALGHMGNTAYVELAIDARFLYFQSRGFSPEEFVRAGIGPVLRREEVEYLRELRLLDKVRINVKIAGLSQDCSRFRIVNELYREDGELSARITSLGGWLDLKARKLVVPPPVLAEALRGLERTPDFEELKSSIRGQSPFPA